MALINDLDSSGNPVVTLTKIVSDAHYIHKTFAMTVWPPLETDGSKPYGEPLVHLFYIDTSNHAQWYRMNPAVDQKIWTHVQNFGYMTGILVYRGIVTMWNPLLSRSYNFYGGSELVFPDGKNGPTSSGADPAGSNLMTNQPFTKGAEQFFAQYDTPGGVNYFNDPITVNEAFCCYLFAYYRHTANEGDAVVVTPPGPHVQGNPTGETSTTPIRAFCAPTVYNGQSGIGAITSLLDYNAQYFGVMLAPEIDFGTPDFSGKYPTPSLKVPFQSLLAKRVDTSGALVDDSFFPFGFGDAQNFRSFTTFGDFAGAGGGSLSYLGQAGTQYISNRGAFHPGYTCNGSYAISKGDAEVWDQELFATETAVTSSLYNQRTFMWGMDRSGVIGSNYLGSTISGEAEIQNDGTSTRFGKCRLVGTYPSIKVVGSFAPPIMPLIGDTASLGLWERALDSSGGGGIYWLTDSQPLLHDAFGKIVPLQEAPVDPPLVFTYSDIPLPPTVTPLGVASSNNTLPHFDLDTLNRATIDPTILPNPNNSNGCSPVLRAIFEMTGLSFSVFREVANDGQVNGHEGGNALDLSGPTPPLTNDSTALSDIVDQELVEIQAFIASVPELFTVALRVNVDNDSESLYIYDGKIVTKDAFSTAFKTDTTKYIHVASSAERIRQALKSPGVRAALGIGPAVSSLVNNKLVVRSIFQLGQFGSRYVYVNQDQLQNVGTGVKGLAISKDNPKIVHFW